MCKLKMAPQVCVGANCLTDTGLVMGLAEDFH